MYIEQLYTNCLAEAAYYIESAGEAAIIDPMREIGAYLELAKKRNCKIKYVFETHFHADFVSGHLDLARATGARIIYGPGATASYEIYSAKDGEEFELGINRIRVLHTPGHTLESACFLLLDERNNPHSVFTGDTLFVGDVGRPDLAVNADMTREKLAGMLYNSLETKIKSLPNYVIVYPGHGAGSACGKSIGSETHSTIGMQKQTNYALKAKSQEQFVQLLLEGLTEPPKYFFMDAAINRKGYQSAEEVIDKNCKPLDLTVFDELIKKGGVVIDTRRAVDFEKKFIPGSINIGLDGNFAVMVGSVLSPEAKLLILADEGQERESVLRLTRIGYENVEGYLKDGINAWVNAGRATEQITSVSAEEFEKSFRFNVSTALDVRNPDEWVPGIVAGAKLIALPKIEQSSKEIDKSKLCYIYCAGGYRSMIAASLLKRMGFNNVVNVRGGMAQIKKTSMPIRQLTTAH